VFLALNGQKFRSTEHKAAARYEAARTRFENFVSCWRSSFSLVHFPTQHRIQLASCILLASPLHILESVFGSDFSSLQRTLDHQKAAHHLI
jgi:hypothetical protein